jgi:dihydroflavonol-4-reductase
MKVLVTGGNGFLGSWLVKRLAAENHSIKVLHRPSSDLSSIRGLPFTSVIGDINDRESVLHAAENVDGVFHVAGLVSYRPRDYKRMEEVNVLGTQNIIDACVKLKTRLVFTSSIVTIGASFNGAVLNEDSKFNLHKYNLGYYETKIRAEKLILKNVKDNGLNAVIVNPAVMFGAGDAVKSSRDAVSGHLSAMEKGKIGERYILGGENIKTEDLFKLLAKFGGHKPPPLPLPNFLLKGFFEVFKLIKTLGVKPRISSDNFLISTLFHWYDSTKAKTELDFAARPAESSVAESVLWAKENGYFKP